MRRLALLAVASGLVGWGLAGALGGCGGDDGVTAGTPDGAASSSGSSGTSSSSGTSGTSSSSGTSGSSGDPGDAAPDGASSSGTVASNPGKITCGAVECDAGGGGNAANRCCVRDAGTNPACSTADLCDNDDLEMRCDETADCPPLNKCCLRLGGGGGGGIGGPRTDCQLGCGGGGGGGGVQVCKTSAECGDAGVCGPKKCGNYNVRVCGTPQGCQ